MSLVSPEMLACRYLVLGRDRAGQTNLITSTELPLRHRHNIRLATVFRLHDWAPIAQLPAFRGLLVLDPIFTHHAHYANTGHFYSPRVYAAVVSPRRYISVAESQEMAEPTTFLTGVLSV
jgi:hypothetical protein